MVDRIDVLIAMETGGDLVDSSGSLIGAIVILVLFILILFGAYFTTRFLGNIQMNRTKDSNLKVIEAIQVGPGKTIQLIKAGEKYFIIGVTKDQITHLADIEADLLNLNKLIKSDEVGPSFSQYLNTMINKRKKNK